MMIYDELHDLRVENDHLQDVVDGLHYELRQRDLRLAERDRYIAQLEQQISELKKQAVPETPLPALPAFVKLQTRKRKRKPPGRPEGHPGALREMPKKINRHQPVPLAKDAGKKPICPRCRTRLAQLRKHRRIVEDLIQATVETTCYHTESGHCPHCQKRIESRDPQQPPAANVPHGQLGINALTTAAILRVRHRLPFRQVAQVLKDLPGLSISAAGLVKQIKRLARWLDGKYQDLIQRMRASPHVHVDETGWRIDGRNFWLWAFTDPTFTLYHVDESRGGKVPRKLLGKAFDGVVVSDFYSAYSGLTAPKQRCLVHLLREVKETCEADQAFRATTFARCLRRWCKDAIALKELRPKLKKAEYQGQTARIEHRLQKIIDLEEPHPDVRRLARRLQRHQSELTRFLYDKALEGTNNRAERALRPAVVMRKITGGNRSQSGAEAWAKLASLMATADHKKLGVYEATKKLIIEYWKSLGR
jgi:transposase